MDANFKEVQLRNIRIGQPVKLTADVYGKKMEYQGTVAGMGAGTGDTNFTHGPKREGLVRKITIDERLEQRPTARAHHAQHGRRSRHVLDRAIAALSSTTHVPEIADALGSTSD